MVTRYFRIRMVFLPFLFILVLASVAFAARPQAPAISGVTLDGKRLSLASLRGKPVILNVWSSW